jgi:4-diphosphocytidyl-2-C-methyl-D-erythritol kinase
VRRGDYAVADYNGAQSASPGLRAPAPPYGAPIRQDQGDQMIWTLPVFVPAYAKINLTLEVLGRRTDGFHEVASVMQTVALGDTIMLSPAPDGTRTLVCDVPELSGEQNLALRAAHLLAETTGRARGVVLDLHKETPTQAGLGGGSSDAASVLLALTRLWEVPIAPAEATRLAAELGSDVPFFLTAGTAKVGGRGEHVAPLPDMEPLWLVLLKPPVAVPTAEAFRALRPEDYTAAEATTALAEAVARRDLIPFDLLRNAFESPIERKYPAITTAKAAMEAAGAEVVRLCGSGPTVFAPFRSLAQAAGVWRRLRADQHIVWLTRTVGRDEAHGQFARLERVRA